MTISPFLVDNVNVRYYNKNSNSDTNKQEILLCIFVNRRQKQHGKEAQN